MKSGRKPAGQLLVDERQPGQRLRRVDRLDDALRPAMPARVGREHIGGQPPGVAVVHDESIDQIAGVMAARSRRRSAAGAGSSSAGSALDKRVEGARREACRDSRLLERSANRVGRQMQRRRSASSVRRCAAFDGRRRDGGWTPSVGSSAWSRSISRSLVWSSASRSGPSASDDVDVARQTEGRADPFLEPCGIGRRSQPIERRIDPQADRRNARARRSARRRSTGSIRRRRTIHPASRGMSSDGRGRRGGRRGSSAGTITSVSTPQTTMLWPISRPSCCRLGKSTNIRP